MSAGEIFDLIRPAAIVLSIFLSTWILISARKRYPLHTAILWAGLALFLPVLVIPLYLVSLLLWQRQRAGSVRGRFIIPTIYLTGMLGIFAAHEYAQSRSVDSYLSAAAFAKVSSDHLTAIKAYRQALLLEDDPHTHKLLAMSLMEAGFYNEAVNEFRAAEVGGEPDDAIHLYLGDLLSKKNQKEESIKEYERFLTSKTCLEVDSRCDSAREMIRRIAANH